jgi:hypothetical protein
VSSKSITYTKELKEKFEEEYCAGKLPSQILADMGIDHRILGKRRKGNLVTRMKLYELRPEGCEDTRKNSTGRPPTKDLTDAEKIKRLEQKITYLNQENEFLKKIFRWIGRQTGNTSETIHQIQTHQRNERTKKQPVKYQLALRNS